MSELYVHLNKVFGHTQGVTTSNEVQEDLAKGMWSEYLEDVKEYDTAFTESWKEDASGVLTFTAIFSATVSAFIIASYPMLSPNSSDKSAFLLDQLSQQFAGFANGTYVQPQPYRTSPPSLSIICVNCIWLLSLVLSTTSALFATLTQQWARRYLQLPQIPSVSNERARVRSYLFLGTLKYAMFHAVETAPTLLHLSVFLFNVGLVIFFFTIFKAVAIVVLVSVVLFGLAYFALTILPCIDHVCPYRTPLSSISWYLWHVFAFLASFFLQWIVKKLHALLVPYNFGDIRSWRQRKLTEWLEGIESSLKRHRKRLGDGFRRSIVRDALQAPPEIDIKALTWLFQLPALTENSKIEKFVAGIPGDTVVRLLTHPLKPGRITFREHLSTLLRSCAPGTVELDEGMRRRLLVCLDAVHHIARAAVVPIGVSLSSTLLNEVRIDFANIELMRTLWADSSPAIRIASRSICALLARQLLRRNPLEGPELAWLGDVIGKPSNIIYNERNNSLATVDNMNIDSFVYGVLSHQTDDLSIVQATSFTDTLAILMNSGSQTSLRRDIFKDQLSSLFERIEQGNHEHRDNVLAKLRGMLQGFLSTSRPPSRA